MGMSFKGMADVKRRIGRLTADMVDKIDAELLDIGESILDRAGIDVPIDTGDTWASGYAQPMGKLKAQVGYGTSYAPIIHVTHPTKDGWFRDAVDAERTGIEARAAKNLGGVLDKVRGG